jgi:hypothetical protein
MTKSVENDTQSDKGRGYKRSWWERIKPYIGWEDGIAIALIVLGIIGYIKGPIPFLPGWTDFYFDNRSTLIGIGITVLIIDNVNEMYRHRAEKKRLILQMGSPNNGFAIEAVRQLKSQGWLFDGTLYDANLGLANLCDANLRKVYLRDADLRGDHLEGANLFGAYLEGADLRSAELHNAHLELVHLEGAALTSAHLEEAHLSQAHLERADVREAHLEGVDLFGAYLAGANLSWANLNMARGITEEQLSEVGRLSGTFMPDGKVYDPAIHTEIARLRKEAGLEP